MAKWSEEWKRKVPTPAPAIDPTDQPLWLIEKWWPTVGWITSGLQAMEPVGDRLVQMRPKTQTTTYARALAILAKAKVIWPDSFDKDSFRLRNIRTGDIMMGALL